MAELQAGDPERIGPYALVGRLGSGGMGRVYLARSPGGRQVAVKVIRAELADDEGFRARFAREVTAARKVGGLFTAQVVDADVTGPVPWLVTAFVPGLSLAEAVDQGESLPPRTVLALAAGLAEGLNAIHAVGVIHRDLKPSNVLLALDGPRIIDFGISSAAEATSLTGAGHMIGSPGFMSPEQAEGRPVGPATDIFSLAGVLTFAIKGEGPFGAGDTTALLYRVVRGTPNLDRIPGRLRPLISWCLSKEAERRPSAAEFLAELAAAYPGTADLTDWLPPRLADAAAQRASSAYPGRQPLALAAGREVAEPAARHALTAAAPADRVPPAAGSTAAQADRMLPAGSSAAAQADGVLPAATSAAAAPADGVLPAANSVAAPADRVLPAASSVEPFQLTRTALQPAPPSPDPVAARGGAGPSGYLAPQSYLAAQRYLDGQGGSGGQGGAGGRGGAGGQGGPGQGSSPSWFEQKPVTARQAPPWYPPADRPVRRRRRGLWVGMIVAVCVAVIAGLVVSYRLHLGAGQGPGAARSSTPPAPTATPTVGYLTLAQLLAGDCLTGANLQLDTVRPWPQLARAVPCGQRHTAEVFLADNGFWASGQKYPGSGVIVRAADTACNGAFRSYVGISYDKSIYTWTDMFPDASSWLAGDRGLHCVAYYSTRQQPAGAYLTGSVKGSRR